MVEDYIQHRALSRIKVIVSIEEFDNTEILVDIDDKLPDNIMHKNVLILMTRIIKDDGNFIHNYS